MIDDAVLILSELLSNSCRYARPLTVLTTLGDEARAALLDPELGDDGGILVHWQLHGDGLLGLEVTDGGSTTRPVPARPSRTSHGGRGLGIVGQLADDWGVRDAPGQVTVWAMLPAREHCASHTSPGARSA